MCGWQVYHMPYFPLWANKGDDDDDHHHHHCSKQYNRAYDSNANYEQDQQVALNA